MSINTNFNENPYYDDFDEDKKFLRLIFKPGYAVQARELTQLQTILQKQTERFGNHIFQNGSVVTGGQTFLQNATYLKLDSSYSGVTITANNFIGATIVDNIQTPNKRAEVIKVYESDAGTGDPKTLLIKQVYGDAFVSGDTILTYEAAPTYANISTSGVGTGQIFSVSEGVFYYDGFFVKNDAQTIATSKYDNTTANAKIGFEITESIVVSDSDTSLLDPALDASNYQAPGSDRFKIDLVLASRSLNSIDTTQFIELARVENGVLIRNSKFPIYSVLEETLARRTFDESGNYTVKPFNISLQTNTSNTANMDVILSPGKAYVYGFEFETIAPTIITVDKPRTTEAIQNKRLTADYGNFVYTTNHYGSLPINNLTTVDLHCVPNASINLTSTASITNTKIGTARVKSIQFDTASNTSNSSTYSYKTFLFDIDVGSLTGNVNVATGSTISIGNVTAGQIFSSVTDAYKGAKLRITTGNGSNETSKYITGFNAATQTITLAESFVNTPANGTSQWAIDFEFNDVYSIATTSSTTKVNAADIESRSRDAASTYSDTFLTDSSFEPLIFALGQNYITQNTISDFSFSYRRLYEAQSFVASDSPALSVASGETITSASSTSAIQQNYQVIVTNAGSSPYTVGQTVPADKITAVNTGTRKLTITNANNMTANIIATIDFTLASGNPAKTKTLVTANSTVQTAGGESINTNGVIVYASQGQTTIQANNVVKTPDTAQSLYVSDVITIEQILDFNGAVVANTGGTDITGRYTLDNGQRDSFYDHASIKLKPGYSAPNGPLVVRYSSYSSSGSGFFTVDSYPAYGSISRYNSPTTGVAYELRDSLDFRPVRKSATNALDSGTITTTFDVDSSTTGPKIPENGSDIILDYSYYLPRVDKIILNKNKTFEVVKGTPALNAVQPKNKDDSMNLYVLTEPAYVANTSDIDVRYINNRRYTMKDIGGLDQRIGNLEYYTSLSLLEQNAINKQDLTILDSTNLPRFKNGIVVDSFKGHSVAGVTLAEYQASIDTTNQELRPSFNISSRMLNFDSANSGNYLQTGPFVTVAASNTTFISQPLASKTMNINPFNVVNYIGRITLSPPSDVWVDTNRKADVLVNIGGDKDAWDLILNNNRNTSLVEAGFTISGSGFGYGSAPTLTITGGGGSGATATATISGGRVTAIRLTSSGTGYTSVPTITVSGGSPTTAAVITYASDFLGVGNFSYEWGDWSTVWTGTTTTGVRTGTQNDVVSGGRGIRGEEIGRNTTVVSSTAGQARTGVASMASVDTITQSIGDKVVDVSVIPYMRSRNVLFTGSDFKPDTVLYPFFDNASVEQYVARANRFILAQNNLGYNVKTAQTETVNVYNNATSTTNGTCIVVKTSNNSVFVVSANPTTAWNIASANLVGQKTGTSVRISGYEHYSGLANTATANTIVLSLDATGANNIGYYGNTSNSNIITIVAGTGVGQQRTISSYAAATRTITISSNWTTTPDITSVYSIGRLTTSRSGDIAGVYTIPPSVFRTGEKLFRLTNTNTGDVPSSSTNGDASFYAQGLLQSVENTIISTLAPTIQRVDVNDTRVSSTIVSAHNEVFFNYYDPLAQTFLVAPTQYPQGIFIEKLRVCFKTKDDSAPVTLQLRPTVNGYPSSTVIYPYGTVTLTSDKVNVTDSPDLDDPTKYTDFVFDTPIYMLPGEHSFVLVSNSNGYEAYVAEVGKLDLVSGLQISEQPYGGSFFMSQNGSTWTADQNMDMNFRIYRKVFDTSPATVEFLIDKPNSNIAFDLAHITTSEVAMANTSVSYSFLSEKATGGLTSYIPIDSKEDYTMDDGNGRRVLNPSTGNTTFILKTTMSTSNPDISPFLDITRFAGIFVDNWITDLPLLNSDFIIANTGSGYANSSDVTVTITGGGGSGAVATATVASNAITAITLTNAGSGYTTSPTITLTPGSGGGTGASVTYNGEDKKSGGNAVARYITRKVTLADGFDSGDLRVYLTAYKPSGSSINVYYKVLSGSDNDVFDNKNYQLMTQLGNPNFVAANKQDYRELSFAPGIAGTANNTISYSSGSTAFNSFKTFAIKVVMSGSNTTDVPKVRDLRAIALPAGN
jgi:hypothetical protein